jgi:phospholipid/cholesterol/gamma-HCH transport system substrate-binding protein
MSKTIKAGIFVTVTIVGVIVAWIWLANVRIWGKFREVIIHSPDVTGLKVNDLVRVWGVEKGIVKGIKFKKEFIEIRISLDPEIILYDDAYAEILDVAMISGTKYVALHPGKSGTLLPPNTPIPGKASLGIPLSMIGDLGEKVGKILSVLETTDVIESITSTLQNLQEATSRLSKIIKDNQKDLRKIAKDLRKSTENLKEMGEKIILTTQHVDSIICNIKEGKGTLGKIVTDDSLYYSINSTLSALEELIRDIKTNPRRYFRLF